MYPLLIWIPTRLLSVPRCLFRSLRVRVCWNARKWGDTPSSKDRFVLVIKCVAISCCSSKLSGTLVPDMTRAFFLEAPEHQLVFQVHERSSQEWLTTSSSRRLLYASSHIADVMPQWRHGSHAWALLCGVCASSRRVPQSPGEARQLAQEALGYNYFC